MLFLFEKSPTFVMQKDLKAVGGFHRPETFVVDFHSPPPPPSGEEKEGVNKENLVRESNEVHSVSVASRAS